jgi:glutamine amidotransferase
MWAGVPDGSWFYFVHSYYADPSTPRTAPARPTTAMRFTCALARDNIFATQFHPEKSAEHGLALYRNFLTGSPEGTACPLFPSRPFLPHQLRTEPCC